jgi:two-component system chemotaxis sensor kinase CheA
MGDYLSESEQLLEELLADLEALGASVSDDNSGPRINLINRIFRAAHSLKGLLGMMGLEEVRALAHKFEDILDALRLGNLALDRQVASLLEEAGVGLAALVGSAARGSASRQDLDRFQELLATIASRARQPKPVANAIKRLGLLDRERALLSQYERGRIKANLSAGKLFYSIVAGFDREKLEDQYRALTSKLDDLGELIAVLPTSGSAPVNLKFILATQLSAAQISGAIEPMGARAEQIFAPKPSKQRGAGGDRASLDWQPLRPLSKSVQVELAQVDEISGLVHELYIETKRLSALADQIILRAGCGAKERFELLQSARRIERGYLTLEERLVELRMVSLGQTFWRAARLAERLARELGKSISVEISGRNTQLDKMIVDRIADPIYHLLRNAVDHGIEPPDERRALGKPECGRISIEASLEGARALIAISDDGRGIDPAQVRKRAIQIGAIASNRRLSHSEALRLIFLPGFSTASEVSAVSGRGFGLDAVERTMHELGGEIRVASQKGRGSRFELVVPTTLLMISAFIVRVARWRYAINVGQIAELIYVDPEDISEAGIDWRGMKIPFIELGHLIGLEPAIRNGKIPTIIAKVAEKKIAVAVERFEGQREIIVKSLGKLARKIKGVVGATDLEGGDVALVLDIPSLTLLKGMQL